jgi:hypothetical protein
VLYFDLSLGWRGRTSVYLLMCFRHIENWFYFHEKLLLNFLNSWSVPCKEKKAIFKNPLILFCEMSDQFHLSMRVISVLIVNLWNSVDLYLYSSVNL